MDREALVRELHDMAAEAAGCAAEQQPTEDADLSQTYAMSSIDALRYLLAIEARFAITFEDEDLGRPDLFSCSRLATRVIALRGAGPSEEGEPGP